MNKLLVLLAILALALAGGYSRGNKIVLQKGKNNSLNFACGGADMTGNAKVLTNQYNYSFQGQPSWLKASGSSLVGNCPVNATGTYPVTVSYNGKSGSMQNSGSSNFYLCFADSASQVPTGQNNVSWLTSGAGNYTVLLPWVTIPTSSNSSSSSSSSYNSSSGSSSSARNCSSIQASLTAAQTNEANIQAQLNTYNQQYAALSANITALKAQQAQLQNQTSTAGTTAINAQIAQITATINQLQSQLITDKSAADQAAASVSQDQGFLATAQQN
jgi:hypothetical protein